MSNRITLAAHPSEDWKPRWRGSIFCFSVILLARTTWICLGKIEQMVIGRKSPDSFAPSLRSLTKISLGILLKSRGLIPSRPDLEDGESQLDSISLKMGREVSSRACSLVGSFEGLTWQSRSNTFCCASS